MAWEYSLLLVIKWEYSPLLFSKLRIKRDINRVFLKGIKWDLLFAIVLRLGNKMGIFPYMNTSPCK